MLNDKIDAFQAVLKSEISGRVSNRHIRGWFLITIECIITGFIKLLAWPNSQFGNWNHKAFAYCERGKKAAEWKSTFRISHILRLCETIQWLLQIFPEPPLPTTEVGLSSHWCVFPHCHVNTARPNTVKLISFHHRASFWLSDKSILSLIINCDTRNQWKAVVLNKWHVFCVIILCILTNMTH